MPALKNAKTRIFFILLTNVCKLLTLLIFLTSFSTNASAEVKRFTDQRNGTVVDASTGLVWIKNPENIAELRGGMIWLKARDSCAQLNYAGEGPGEWRLPDIDELQTILAESGSPRIDNTMFAALPTVYWTTTPYSGPGANVWVVDFANGQIGSRRKLNLLSPEYLRARCVRDQ